MRSYLDAAKKYLEHGIHTIPVNEDKLPCLPTRDKGWSRFRDSQTVGDLESIFTKPSHGIAMLTGVGNVEVIDVDTKYDLTGTLMEDFDQLLCHSDIDISKLTVAQTKSGGFHVIYKSPGLKGNTKLARRPTSEEEKSRNPNDRVKVLLETRGIGGYVLCHPTPGYTVRNGKMLSIKSVSEDQRNKMMAIARSFDEMPIEPVDRRSDMSGRHSGKTTIEDYNDKTYIPDILEGWAKVRENAQRIYFCRPGKSKGVSGDYHIDKKIFKSWSTSTEFEAEKAYSAFGVYAILHHRGDFSSAAKDLYSKGFGDRMSHEAIEPISSSKKEEPDDLFWARVSKCKFDYNHKPPEIEYMISLEKEVGAGIVDLIPVGARGDLGLLTGIAKSGKSSFLQALCASGISGEVFLKFRLKLNPGENIILIDTEQPEHYFHKASTKSLHMAGLTNNHPNYHSFQLLDFEEGERMRALRMMIEKIGNVGLIVIDSAMDMVLNYNKYEECKKLVTELMRIASEENCIVLGIIHRNRMSDWTMGHLGSIWEKKCGFAIEVNKSGESGFSEISHKLSRTATFPGFEFTWDRNGYPILDHNHKINIPKSVDEGFDPEWEPGSKEEADKLLRRVDSTAGVKPVKMNDDENVPF